MFGKLTGTVLAIWDADSLERNPSEGNPTPTYINITDSTFKPIATLPSPSGDLSDIIVLSTTLKNRYLLQFANSQLLKDWTAALRLTLFEYTSLQEAYTGALLSSKGAKLNGIRTLLTETKFHHEDWVSVRFGAGMPWKKCWTVVTPPTVKKKKNMPPPGTIAFYEDKKTKKAPLALISGSYSTYAVYPQNSVLINSSTLIKVEGKVTFNDIEGEKDAAVFLMPEPHPGVPGFETLIRFLVPVLDVFKLYGRPARLNADKMDMCSLLFAMPSLPFTQYLELSDAQQLVATPGSENWAAFDWTKNIKEHLHQKLSNGYKGCGKLQRSNTTPKSSESNPSPFSSARTQERNRSASFPQKMVTEEAATSSATVESNSPIPNRQPANNQPQSSSNNPYNNGPGYPPNNNPQSFNAQRSLGPLNTSLNPGNNSPGPVTPISKNSNQNYNSPNARNSPHGEPLVPPSGPNNPLSPQSSGGSYRGSPMNSANASSTSVNSNPGSAPRTPNFSRPPYSNPNGSNSSFNSNKTNALPYPDNASDSSMRPPNQNYAASERSASPGSRQNVPYSDKPGALQYMNRPPQQQPAGGPRPPQQQYPSNGPRPQFQGPQSAQSMARPPQEQGQQYQGPRPMQQGPRPMQQGHPGQQQPGARPMPQGPPPQQYQGPPPQQYQGPRPGPQGQQYQGPRPMQQGPPGQQNPGPRPMQNGPPGQQQPGPRPMQQGPPGQQYPGPRPIQQGPPSQQGPRPMQQGQQHPGPRPMHQGPPPSGARGPIPNGMQPGFFPQPLGPRPLQQGHPPMGNLFDPTVTIPNHNHTVGERTYT